MTAAGKFPAACCAASRRSDLERRPLPAVEGPSPSPGAV